MTRNQVHRYYIRDAETNELWCLTDKYGEIADK
jgi:hypothetical protein